MAKKQVYLAVDLGASSGRVMGASFDGRRIALDEIHRFGNPGHAVLGSFHWDFLQLFAEIKAGLAKGVARHGRSAVSLGIDTWGVDYGLVDRRGRLLGLPHQYRDPRTNGMEKRACRRMPREQIYGRTGIQFMFFNTLLQLVAEQASGSAALEQAQRILFTPDLFNYWLTGVQANEYTIASTSQLLDARSRDWAWPVIKALGLPKRIFRDLVAPGTALGRVTPEVAGEIGAAWLRVIAPGCHDTASAVAAVPARGSDHAYLSSGTWSLMGVEVDEPVMTDKAYAYNFTNEGGVGGKVRLLKNICGLWLQQECKRIWEKQGEKLSYEDFSRLAAAAKPFTAIIDTDCADFAQPCDMPARIRAFCKRTGQRAPATPGEVIRTILESLALKYRRVLGMLEDLTGRRYATLHIVGGGSQNALLNPFAANALQRPVVAGPVEATAIGNVLMQMIATGAVKSLEQGRDIVRSSFATRTFKPADRAAWDAAYETYLRVEGK